MDTMITRISDTLLVHNITRSNYPDIWLPWISVGVSILAMLLSVFWNWYAGWKKEITTQWTNQAASRLKFWITLDDTYEKWDGSIRSNFPTLGELLKCAGIPNQLEGRLASDRLGKLIESLERNDADDTKSCQKALFQFCYGIWHKRISIYGPLDLDGFGAICSSITWSFDGWAKIFCIERRFKERYFWLIPPQRYLLGRFGSDWALLTILVYLELALKTKIKERWSNRDGLFKLAHIINEQR